MNKKIQKNIIQIVIGILIFILFLLLNNKVYGKNYSINNMDIKATVLDNGDINIIQSITYDFNGSYNGIYITIPYSFYDYERDEIDKKTNQDEIYNGTGVLVNSVIDSNNTTYKEVSYASNGERGRYTVHQDREKYTIKVYSPSNNESKTFVINYNINDVCVSYNDIGELYYNFIGGKWDVGIKNLNIDIILPHNQTTDDLYAYGHGPYNGTVDIISKNKVNLKVKNVKKGQYVAARVIFNKQNIEECTKNISIDGLEKIIQEEMEIQENKQSKTRFTYKVLAFTIILFIYWIVLIYIYEKDKKYITVYSGEGELFEKYNPLIAGCIQGSRQILARDIIAVILNLIDKKIIELKLVPSTAEPYRYVIKETKNAQDKMDEIETYIYNWVFKERRVVNLSERLKEMPKETDANKKFKELNKIANKKLNKIGANISKVPPMVRVFNVILFIISLILVYTHIQYNKFEIYNGAELVWYVVGVIVASFSCIPFILGVLYIPINLLIATRHRVHKIVRKFTGQKIVTTTVSVVLIFLVIILFTALITKTSRFLIIDELLICMALLIMITDNLMLKNNAIMIEDFSRLNMLKEKLEEDTLFEERDIEQVVLWGKYLAYGVAFGTTKKISKRIKDMHLDYDLESFIKNNNIERYIESGYYDFYRYASLDRRFVKSYNSTIGKVLTSSGGSSGGGGRGGGFSRRPEDFLGGGGRGGGRWSILNKKGD